MRRTTREKRAKNINSVYDTRHVYIPSPPENFHFFVPSRPVKVFLYLLYYSSPVKVFQGVRGKIKALCITTSRQGVTTRVTQTNAKQKNETLHVYTPSPPHSLPFLYFLLLFASFMVFQDGRRNTKALTITTGRREALQCAEHRQNKNNIKCVTYKITMFTLPPPQIFA